VKEVEFRIATPIVTSPDNDSNRLQIGNKR